MPRTRTRCRTIPRRRRRSRATRPAPPSPRRREPTLTCAALHPCRAPTRRASPARHPSHERRYLSPPLSRAAAGREAFERGPGASPQRCAASERRRASLAPGPPPARLRSSPRSAPCRTLHPEFTPCVSPLISHTPPAYRVCTHHLCLPALPQSSIQSEETAKLAGEQIAALKLQQRRAEAAAAAKADATAKARAPHPSLRTCAASPRRSSCRVPL